jgi:hypothetical protein
MTNAKKQRLLVKLAKILSVLAFVIIAFAMLFSCVPKQSEVPEQGEVVIEPVAFTLSGEGYYIISCAGNLTYFRNRVNGGEPFKEEKFVLYGDIDLMGVEWVPIGTKASVEDLFYSFSNDTQTANCKYFAGVFDGNGHSISNFVITKRHKLAGLFGQNTGTIKNLTVKDFSIDITEDLGLGIVDISTTQNEDMVLVWAAGVVAYNFGRISNVRAEGKINVSVANVGEYIMVSAAGIATVNRVGGVIENCTAVMDISILATNETVVGGIIAGNYGKVHFASFYGNVNAHARTAFAGGVIGRNHGGIYKSYAVGNVEAKGNTEYDITYAFAGGLSAINNSPSTAEDVSFNGTVKATGSNAFAGGLVGEEHGLVKNGKSNAVATALGTHTSLQDNFIAHFYDGAVVISD